MQRIIMHVDMNSYFASVEQQANPFLRGKPIGITGKRQEDFGRSVVAAASIEAKARGAKTAMSTWEAKRICPDLILIAGDPEKYSEITHRFNRIFTHYASAVELFSVDESFLDVTETAKDYLGAILMAKMIKEDLKTECGERVTASIGIAPNKAMAKLASEQVKPNGLTVAKPDQVLDLLDGADLQDLCGIGPRIERHLHALGITNFKQLRQFPLADLVKEFKSYGYWLHRVSFGIDESEVVSGEADPKSVGHSYTLPKDTWVETDMKRYLLGLCDKVAWRLRRDGFLARCLSTYVRYGDFTGHHQSKRFNEPTADGLKLFKMCWEMIRRFPGVSPLTKGGLRGVCEAKPVRLLGLSTSLLVSGTEPPPLFKKSRQMVNLLPSLDRIQHRYGAGSWSRASLLPIKFKARSSGFHYDHEM